MKSRIEILKGNWLKKFPNQTSGFEGSILNTVYSEIIITAMEEYSQQHQQGSVRTEYGMCPKCNGSGRILNTVTSTSIDRECDYCNGEKSVVTAIISPIQSTPPLPAIEEGWIKVEDGLPEENKDEPSKYYLCATEFKDILIKLCTFEGGLFYPAGEPFADARVKYWKLPSPPLSSNSSAEKQ